MAVFGQFLLNTVLCGTQIAAMLLFVNRENRRPRFLLRMLLCSVLGLLYAALTAQPLFDAPSFWINVLLYFGMFAVTIAWCFVCCRDRFLRTVYNVFSGILLRLAISSLANFPLFFLPDQGNLRYGTNWLLNPLMHLLVGVVVLFAVDHFLIREIRENKDFVPGKAQLWVMVILVSVMLAYLGYTGSAMQSLLFYGVRAVFCLLVLTLFYLTWKQARVLAQNALEKRIDEEQLRHYADLGDVIQTMNIKAHDLRHQIRALKTGSVVTPEVISELTDTVRNYETYVQTGNPTLDVILTDAALRCERAHVEANFAVAGEDLSFLSTLDLNALFGNAIDNALEYLATVPEEDRLFWIDCGVSNGFIRLRFENLLVSDIAIGASGVPQTTKSDTAYHGFGTQSIRAIAQKYHGSAAFNVSDGVFTVCVVLPLPDNNKES